MSKRKGRRIETSGPGTGVPKDAAANVGKGADSKNQPAGLTHNPFASLGATLGIEPAAAGEAACPGEPSNEAPSIPGVGDLKGAGAVILRHERKGHGGKTVTIADFERLDSARVPDLTAVAKALAKKLGLGARAVDRKVVLQGEVLDRAEALLQDLYGAKVTRGTHR